MNTDSKSESKASPPTKGTRVELKKAHPCGGRVFIVERIGMDCKLKCETCGARITLIRSDFNKRLKNTYE